MEENIIELTDIEGKKKKFEILDLIEKDEIQYAVMLPEDSEDEVVIFKVEVLNDDIDEANYIEVEDENLAEEIFEEFIAKQEQEKEE